jgi:outer membrane receptor protein involved in Fe transport
LIPTALLLLPVFAFAQSVPQPVAKPVPPAATEEKIVPVEASEKSAEPKAVQLQSYEVTGSRIRTLGQEAAALPVFTITQVELERRGVSRLADVRWAIPQLSAAVGFNDNLQNGGTSRAQQVGTSFNLRGLGGNSTLVLIDGKRIPHTGQEAPGGAGGREDFSVDGIPVGAIERIEILPEGAGAIYGSEAIAGVVNIILKKNYTGAELRVSYDNAFKTDVGQTTVSLLAGYRVGKVSTFLTLSYEKQNGMASRDRWFTATADSRVYGAASASFYLSQVASGAGSLSSTTFPANANQPNLPGLTTNIVGIPSGSNGTTAANTAYTTAVPAPYDPNQFSMAIDPATRRSVTFKAEYDHATWAKVYVDGRASEFRNEFTGPPITLSTTLPVGYAGNPFPSAVAVRKVFWDLPLPYTISKQQNKAISGGVRGDFLDTWRYDISASLARNVVIDDAVTGGGFNTTVLNSLINNPDPALRPILAYDSTRFSSPALFQSAFLVPDHKDTTDYLQYAIAADGSVWSGWAGDVKLAVGAELGEEKVRFYRDASIATPTFVLTKPFNRDSKATYAEVTIPLLSANQKIPLVHRVEVGGAVRAQDYEDIGGVTTPTYRALFQPVSWITLRTSRSEGFKPVRLYDLLGPVTTGTTTLTTTSNVRDNRRGGEPVIGTFTRSFGGNPALRPEESVSKNGGIVIDIPGKWFKGLSFSADYYQFNYTDRSGGPGTQVLFDFFPERVTRAPATAADTAAGFLGPITTWDATNINIGKVWTKGWDFRASYSRAFDFGDLMLTAAMSDPNVTVTQSTPAAVPSSAFGHQPRRLSGSAFWARGAWELGLSVNHQETYFINGLTGTAFPSYTEYNPQASYNFAKDARFSAQSKVWWERGLAGSKVTVTIINAANREPDMIDAANGRIVMDPRLRRYIVSFAKKF